jgi:pilus assembly protein Flp/PilA
MPRDRGACRGTPVAICLGASRKKARTKRRDRNFTTRFCASERRALEDAMKFVNAVRSFVRGEEGQDLLEYALLVALIALVAVGAVTAAGGSVKTIFTNIGTELSKAAGSSS